MGVFIRTMEGLAAAGAERETIRIGEPSLKAHRTASRLAVGKGGLDA